MSTKEKDIFLRVLKNIRVPDGYSSNISRCVHPNERSIWGLKSHDNHILMQQLLPIALRRVLPKHVVKALIEISNCFTILCSNVTVKYEVENLEDRMALTLCSLEKIFPPGFFDIMEHLPIHLAHELQNAGPVQYRWMRDAFSYKGYIVRGFRFRVKEIDDRRKTQNSGVICTSGDTTFYGQLTHIFKIHYFNGKKFVLFKCNWINERVGKKVDEFKFTLVNFKHLLYNQNRLTDEPFILASQADQVFYVQDPLDSNWHVVVKTKPRDRFDKYSNVENETTFLQGDPFSMQDLDISQRVSWVRDEIDGSIVDTRIPENNNDDEEIDE